MDQALAKILGDVAFNFTENLNANLADPADKDGYFQRIRSNPLNPPNPRSKNSDDCYSC